MKIMGIIFSNIYDSTLGELTNHRTVASLPFGGRYRQIDFALSNMSNSGIYNIGIITKYNYRSLMDHLGTCSAWDLNKKNEGVVFLPPFAKGNTGAVYKGKLEALYSALYFIGNTDYDYVVMCDSTVLCNLNLRAVVEHHIDAKNDITVVSKLKKSEKNHPLILTAKNGDSVTDVKIDSSSEDGSYVGMGMFVMSRSMLYDAVCDCHSRGYVHFERDYLLRKFNENAVKIGVYPFEGVVLFNEDVASYYSNSMSLLQKQTRDGIFLKESPIYTKVRDEAPTYYEDGAKVSNCIVADGCLMSGRVEDSVIFREVVVEKDAYVKSCVIMQGAKIGQGARLECVILDKNVTVSEGTSIKGTPGHPVIIKKGERI